MMCLSCVAADIREMLINKNIGRIINMRSGTGFIYMNSSVVFTRVTRLSINPDTGQCIQLLFAVSLNKHF